MIPDPPETPASPPEPTDAKASIGTVKVQKRQPAPQGLREKLCAGCGRTFALADDEKFYLCPACYRRAFPARKTPHKGGTRVLVHIKCVSCGCEEYLDFQPPDPAEVLCRKCFTKQRKEQKQR